MVINIDTVMSIEEKAKAYDEAIRKIQEIIIMDNAPVTPKEIGEYLFPNLKESDDKKMLREIKRYIKEQVNKPTGLPNGNVAVADMLAWLEKQEKSNFEQSIQNGDNIVTNEDGTHFNVSQLERVSQKATETKETAKKFLKSSGIMDKNGELADEYRLEKQGEQEINDEDTIQSHSFYSYKGEPKFKVGDWIADSNNKITEEDWRIGKINEIKDGKFKFESVYGYTTDFPIGTLNQYHLWTINDARDCDVLKEDSCIFMIEKMSKTGDVMVHCCLFNDGEFSPRTTLHFDVESIVPATKEECEHMFTKMKEMGYECNITDLMARKTGKKPINKELIKSVKTEPKFKVGDWITDGYLHNKITDVLEDRYIVDTKFAKRSAILFKFEHYYHLWSLKDAKDGDVLAFDNDNIVIFKDLYNNTSFHSYCHIEDGIFDFSTDGLPDWWEDEGFKPATKEQCDLLFQKMKKAGYEWDAENKELKEIHNALEECEIEHIEHGKYYYCIKDYFAGGKKQASKGDVVQALRGLPIMALGVNANEYFLPVNSIKQNHAWSEEDERNLKCIMKIIKEKAFADYDVDEDNNMLGIYGILESWLKSLKPQPQWKPSEEQIQALEYQVHSTYAGSWQYKASKELLEQLKKL